MRNPGYNCGPFLHRCWESLQEQTYRDFEWIIIDDGSTDGTAEVVEPWIRAAAFPIRYHYQDNAGKMSAVNKAVLMARGEYIVLHDADDRLMPNALERMLTIWNSLTSEQRESASGVVGHCQDQHGNFVGDEFPESPLICDQFDLVYKHRITGDKESFTRRDVLLQFPFETKIDSFVPEAHAWMAMAMKYKEVYVNEVFLVYYRNQEDRESLSDLKLSHIRGHWYFYLLCLNQFLPRLPFRQKLRYMLLFLRATCLLEDPAAESIAQIQPRIVRWIATILLPLGWLFAVKHQPPKAAQLINPHPAS